MSISKEEAMKELMDIKKFLRDGETCCFDCGADGKYLSLTKLSDGVALCLKCLEEAKDDYPKGDE